MHKWFFSVVTVLLTPELMAQNPPAPAASRADQIHQERQAKARSLQPYKPTKVEKYFTLFEKVMRRSPVTVGVGGLGAGAGLTIGSEYKWNSSGDQVRSRSFATVSTNHFWGVGTGLELPHIGGRNLNFVVAASHRDAPQLEYYGSGPDSSQNDRTNFRKEDTLVDARVELRPHRHIATSCRLGQLFLNVGPGTNHSLPTTESVFGPAEAPGIDAQTNYAVAGCRAELDLRDFPGDPQKGTYLAAGYERYFAEDDDQFSYHRLSAVAVQYIPFWNQNRVIALRAKTEFSLHSGDQVVPFYMQTTLGSDEDLRGFRRYRFYGENSIVLNAEYRWEVSTRFDMALFVDAGKVFNRPGEVSLHDLETSAGFGFRFKDNESIAARFDTAFSREGFHVWLKFGRLF
jgi:hypothetical protein